MKLTPYPKYRDPEWVNLENLPSHWDLLRNKYLFRISKETVGKQADEYTLLSLTLKGIIPRDLDNPTGKFPAEFDSYQKVFPGDLIFCLFDIDETPRTVGFSKKNGTITGAYTVVRCFSWMNPEYLYFYYLFLDTHKGLRPFYTGLRKVIKPEVFLGLKTPVPPKKEQDQIVRFLNIKFAQIAKFIRNKHRLIKLLKEQKQAIINQAVTRGINLNVKMKPSGIDWLGDIPEHWEIRKLKNIGKGIIGLTFSPSELSDESGILVLRASNVKNGKVVLGNDIFVRKDIPSKLFVKLDDILICSRSGSRALVGKSALIQQELKEATFGVFMTIYRSSMNDFIYYVLNSSIFGFLAANFATSTINQLTLKALHNLVIPFPPRDEQLVIVDNIIEKTKDIDSAVDKTGREIDLIQEYRTRLISDVVTGKMDVRDIKVEDISDEDLSDDFSSFEETEELEGSIKEVSNEY